MVKITKLFALPKFGSPWGSTSPSLKIGEILAIRKNLASFWNWGSHLFYATCWQIYYLYKQNNIGSSATRASGFVIFDNIRR